MRPRPGDTVAERPARLPTRRSEIKAFRRRQLVAATIDVIADKGFAGTTLGEVAKRAGMSRGIVNFHFASKEALLIATLRHLADEYAEVLDEAMGEAGQSAAARLAALVEVDFHPTLCTRRKIRVWRAFWAESRARPAVRRLRATLDARYADEAEALCARLIAEGGYEGIAAGDVARGLNAMIDGLWEEFMMHPVTFDRSEAKRICMVFLSRLFPDAFASPEPAALTGPVAAPL